ncbi:MBL fold metallo-hydrolase [Pseudogracilibacillus sp. SE30717A]|uniref:MBL fold metallo-hydrolase n=1 Tax=Pseudogracilibacillus sp. SE30717A TaxID=3098293 RepID=UPI00300E18BF
MKIKILGYWGGYPSQGGATAGYLITTEEGQILLDCGSGVMSKLSLHTKVENLNAVILSHLHFDHTADIGILQYAAVGALRTEKMKNKLKVYAPTEPASNWKAIQSEETEFLPIDESRTIYTAGLKIEFKSVTHTIPCYAVKFTYKDKVFVYSADTAYDESLIDFAQGADIFICEATICPGSIHTVGTGHMDATEAGQIAKKANVKQLILTHLPHDGDFQLMKEQAEEAFGNRVFLPMETEELFL